MLRYLQGTVETVEGPLVVLDVQGWGFELQVSRAARSRALVGESLRLFTALQVSESGVALFGFLRESERSLFQRLTSVKGVGGKVAMALLGTLEEETLVRSILSGDLATLSSAPGVGRKTAERLCFELRERLGSYAAGEPGIPANFPGALVLEALESLGFSRSEAAAALRRTAELSPSPATDEELLQAALKTLRK